MVFYPREDKKNNGHQYCEEKHNIWIMNEDNEREHERRNENHCDWIDRINECFIPFKAIKHRHHPLQ